MIIVRIVVEEVTLDGVKELNNATVTTDGTHVVQAIEQLAADLITHITED